MRQWRVYSLMGVMVHIFLLHKRIKNQTKYIIILIRLWLYIELNIKKKKKFTLGLNAFTLFPVGANIITKTIESVLFRCVIINSSFDFILKLKLRICHKDGVEINLKMYREENVKEKKSFKLNENTFEMAPNYLV